jgi:polysaccharide export outer membrane protein
MKAWIYLIALLFFAPACVPYKKVIYFSDLAPSGGPLAMPEPRPYTLTPGDVIEINISSVSRETNDYFAKPGSSTDRNFGPNTWQIAEDGTIDIPLIGAVAIGGLTLAAAETTLRERLTKYLQQPTVNVRLMSFRITVLGEVSRPGVYDVPNGQINLLEALGMAGDLTLFARRDNVLLVRNDGTEKIHRRLNLNQSDVLASEWFHLRNNDVLYVQPSKGRTAADDNLYRILPLTVSALTFVVLIISISQ